MIFQITTRARVKFLDPFATRRRRRYYAQLRLFCLIGRNYILQRINKKFKVQVIRVDRKSCVFFDCA